jgi:hypothetical protein
MDVPLQRQGNIYDRCFIKNPRSLLRYGHCRNGRKAGRLFPPGCGAHRYTHTNGNGLWFPEREAKLTTKEITRTEAESQILEHVKAILEIYHRYNPKGDYLYTHISKDYIDIHNDCAFGGVDHDYPLMIQVDG